MTLVSEAIQPYFVLLTVAGLFVLLYLDKVKPAIGFVLCILVFIVSGIITSKEALAGFSNESIASIALLILISAGVRYNFNIEYYLDKLFLKADTYKKFLVIMMAKVAVISSFINNTPVVAMMTPYIFNWGRKNNISPSKLLIPLSYATIIGGMITVIGTSTTMVLNGFLLDKNLATLNSWELLLIGGAATAGLILFMVMVGHKMLPNHQDIMEQFKKNKREYLVEKRLSNNSPLIGKTVSEGGLRNLGGVYLVEIVRDGNVISPVRPTETICNDDILIFAGNTENIVDLTRSGLGIELPKDTLSHEKNRVDVSEAVISNNSGLVGKTVKEAKFRNRYDAAVVAIHRNGEKLSGKIGDIIIKPGDALLMYAGDDFNNRVDLLRDLIVISQNKEKIKTSKRERNSLLVVVFASVLLLSLGYFSLFTSILIIFSLMVLLKMITMKNLKRDLDVNMMTILVFSLVIGETIDKTGGGKIVADWLLGLLSPFGMHGILMGIMLITTILTSFISNVGAVSIAFPLALAFNEKLGIPIEESPFYIAIAFSASAAFLTPMGYQTNLIIYAPGGYSFKDFFKVGLPVTLLYLTIVFLFILYLYHPL